MRKAHGFGEIIGDPGRGFSVGAHDMVNCIHCGHIDMVRSKTSGNLEVMVVRADGSHYFLEAGFCRQCMEPICPKCNGKPCSNRHRRMEQQEKAALKASGSLFVPARV